MAATGSNPLYKRRVGAAGGDGGDVIIRAASALEDLNMNKFVFNGVKGGDAKGQGLAGGRGRDVIVHVPCGTVVKDVQRVYILDPEADVAGAEAPEPGTEHLPVVQPSAPGKLPYRDTLTRLGEVTEDGDSMLVARGGAGGLGNASFRRDEDWPETPHIAGEPGQLRFLELELKVLADIGLVGFPNAGKSSLLASMSAAQPKVADYPFTTLSPVMGVLRFGDGSSLRVADVPGLITGASEDRGLGHEFLRHIERSTVLVYVVDASGSDIAAGQEEGADEGGGVDRLRGPRPSEAGLTPSQRRVRRAVDDLAALQEELRAYNPALLARPALVVANKTDLPGTQNTVEALRQATLLPVVAVSALQRAGLPLLVRSLKWLHDTASQQGGGSGR